MREKSGWGRKDPYQVGRIRLRLPELQDMKNRGVKKFEARKVKAGSGSPYQIGGMRLRLGPVGLAIKVREANKT